MLAIYALLLFPILWHVADGIASPSWPRRHSQLQRRQTGSAGSCNFTSIKSTTGGRNIGLVIDNSNSMNDHDPNDLRFSAANFLNDALISSTEAASANQSADSIAVVFFWSEPNVAYPLGDPAGATAVLQSTGLQGGTFIGGGVREAIEELLLPGNSTSKNDSAIVIFTDGEDDPTSGITQTIAQINRAADLGIRVFLGFLVPNIPGRRKPVQDTRITLAVLRSGGRFTTIDSDLAQRSFVEQILLYGLTTGDQNAPGTVISLYPGLNSTALVSATGSTAFKFPAAAGESFNITLTTPNRTVLTATLQDEANNNEIQQQQTNTSGLAFLEHSTNAQSSFILNVSASGTNPGDTIFSVYLQSSLGSTGLTTCTQNITNETTVPFTGISAKSYPGKAMATVTAAVLALALTAFI